MHRQPHKRIHIGRNSKTPRQSSHATGNRLWVSSQNCHALAHRYLDQIHMLVNSPAPQDPAPRCLRIAYPFRFLPFGHDVSLAIDC